MNEPRRPPPALPASSPRRDDTPAASAPTVRVSSAQLFGTAVEVQIDHHGAVYRLKQTSLGKLILTK